MSSLEFNSTAKDKLQLQAAKLIDAQQFNSIEWQLSQRGKRLSRGIELNGAKNDLADSPIYRIYSMTKPVVSFVAMQLIDEGKLSLDDELSRYIPAMAKLQVLDTDGSAKNVTTPITIEHLLTHTAGFSYDFLPGCPVGERYRAVQISGDASRSLSEVIGMLTTMPLAYQPGTQWRYSVATDVLAHVLENVSEMDLHDLLNARVFEPLNMQDTAFFVPQDKQDRLLPMFGARELGEVMVDSVEPNVLNSLDVNASHPITEDSRFYRGGHGLYSTLDDYVKFMHVLETGLSPDGTRMLSEPNFELMWTNRINPSWFPLQLGFTVMGGYGWGLMGRVIVDPAECEVKTVMGEGGWSGAASTHFWIDRTNGISGISMSQYIGSTSPLGPLMQHAAYGMFI